MLPLTSWAVSNGLSGGNAASSANPDGDSLVNLQEYAFGMNTTSPSLPPLSYASGGTSNPGILVMEKTGTTQSPDYRAVFARRKDHVAVDLTYNVELSAYLTYWESRTEGMSVIVEGNPSSVDAVSIPSPLSVPLSGASGAPESPPKFFRVTIKED